MPIPTSTSVTPHPDRSSPSSTSSSSIMAFVFRKGRDVPAEGFVDRFDDIGPGSYFTLRTSPREMRPSFAPFATSQTRDTFGLRKKSAGPGPQAYFPRGPERSGRIASMESKTERFPARRRSDADETPGPGRYDVKRAARPPRRQRRESRSSSSVVIPNERSRPIPSIPSKSAKYGYDIDATPANERVDRHEPGMHDVKMKWIKDKHPRRKNALMRGAGNRFRRESPQSRLVGPGSYDPRTIAASPLIRNKASASFSSQSSRGSAFRVREEGPPPNAYDVRKPFDTCESYKTKPIRLQCFGTTEDRFKSRVPPGTYVDDTKPIFSSFARATRTSSTVRPRAAFSTSALRFHDRELRNQYDEPGPQAYTPSDASFANQIRRKALKKQRNTERTSFQSSSARFPKTDRRDSSLSSTKCYVPGPGAYVVRDRWVRRDTRRQPTSAFASKTARCTARSNISSEIRPEPGLYDVNMRWVKDTHPSRKNVLMKGAGNRFRRTSSHVPLVGPGSYDLPSSFDPHESEEQRGQVMVSTEKRFRRTQRKMMQETPGPGTYDDSMLYGNLNKRTFNITIASEMYS